MGANEVARDPPIKAPTRKAARAVRDRGTERPGVPAHAKPRKTIFPVMLAVNTWRAI